jgi:hypothetical protein
MAVYLFLHVTYFLECRFILVIYGMLEKQRKKNKNGMEFLAKHV